MSALSTHDTKRSEDVRARLNVLSELPDEWERHVKRWAELNARHSTEIDGKPVPSRNEEYFIYQTLLGAWPLEPYGPEEFAAFVKRVQAYMEKAMREAKVHTSWVSPSAEYEAGVKKFLARILDEQTGGGFLRDLRPLQQRVSHLGLLNSLSQTVLRLTAPGVPDTYQGSELWDFSLVDPDNRRPVDYDRRRRMLQDLKGRVDAGFVRELLERKEDGRVKLFVTRQALICRRDHAGLFSAGQYFPCEADGASKEHVFGFARRRGNEWAVVAVPRLVTGLPASLGDTALLLPAEMSPGVRFRNVFTGEQVEPAESQGRPRIRLADAFGSFPVALLISQG
jgi:(1->4)-alpha-D-glucan 1-alpha-D-glucosylmutase